MRYVLIGMTIFATLFMFAIFASRYRMTDEQQCQARIYGATNNIRYQWYKRLCLENQ